MGFWSGLAKIGGAIGSIAAAPFTAGTSLAWLPAALGGVSALGGLLENTKGARTGTQTGTQTTTPGENPQFANMGNLLRSLYERRLNADVPLEGYEASGLQGINDAFAGVQQNLDANLTSRGLATSPVAGAAQSNLQAARGGQMAQFLNNLPLLRRQLQDQDIAQASAFYSAQPRPTTTTQTGTFVQPGSAGGSAFSSAAEMIAYLAGKGLFGGGAKKDPLAGVNI